jgi:hypothetical protein
MAAAPDRSAVDICAYRRYIEDALEYAGHSHTFDDVAAMVASGEAQFWPGPNSAIVTEFVLEPRTKRLNFFLAGGTLAELEAMTPLVLEWGREQGCTTASLIGRRGWERTFLSRTGWKSGLVVLEKDLTDG